MSARSRLESHRRAADPRLFHTSAGMVHPAAAMLTLSERMPDDQSDWTHDQYVQFLGVLLHERHHWLQQVGTLSGIFHTLVLEAQASAIGSRLEGLRDVEAAHLPLAADPDRHPVAVWWERAEATRRLFFGCRTGDLQILFDARRSPIYADLSRLIGEILLGTVAEAQHTGPWFDTWSAEPVAVTDPPKLFRHRGWAVGSRHLMEFTARVSEAYRVAQDAPAGIVDLSALFTGIYAVVPEILEDVVPTRDGLSGNERHVVLAAVCDLALSFPRPPLTPLDDRFVDERTTPAVELLVAARGAAEGAFPDVDVTDPESVRGLISAYYDRCEEHLGVHPTAIFAAAARQMHGFRAGYVGPGDLYELEGKAIPRPTANGARVRYHLDLCARAFQLRVDHPELFVFPYCHYAADRKAFHGLYDDLAPPLLRYGDLGPAHADPPRGWIEYWTVAAAENILFRNIVYDDADGVAAALRGLTQMADEGRAARFLTLIGNALSERSAGSPVVETIRDRLLAPS